MTRPRVMPILLLKGSGLVKTVRFDKAAYVGDPLNAVKIFNDKQTDELIILDIEASKIGSPIKLQKIEQIASECFMPLCYGGGIRSLEDIRNVTSAGVEKVSINSAIHEDPHFISRAADSFGSSAIVASIDTKKNIFGKTTVYTRCGTQNTKKCPIEFSQECQRLGAGELLINCIDNDGVMKGLDLEIINSITEAVNIPVVACGGVGCLDHIVEAFAKTKASAVAAGSFFVYHGKHRAVLINYLNDEQIISLKVKSGAR